MHHFLYKTTRMTDGHYYVGMHSSDDSNDGYMGSGVRILRSLTKYGKSNHRFEILEYTDDRESLVLRESEVVSDAMLSDPLCMNLIKGGTAPSFPRHRDIGRKISESKKGKKLGSFSAEHRAAISAAKKGMKASAEAKLAMSEARKGRKFGPCSETRRQAIILGKRATKVQRDTLSSL